MSGGDGDSGTYSQESSRRVQLKLRQWNMFYCSARNMGGEREKLLLDLRSYLVEEPRLSELLGKSSGM